MFGRQCFFLGKREMEDLLLHDAAWLRMPVISLVRKRVYPDHIKSQLRCRPANASQYHSFLNNYEEDPR